MCSVHIRSPDTALHNPVFANIKHYLVKLRSQSHSGVLILELKINVLTVSVCHASHNLLSETDWARMVLPVWIGIFLLKKKKKRQAKKICFCFVYLQEWRWTSWRTHSHTSARSAILLHIRLCTLRLAETLLYLSRALFMHWSKMLLESVWSRVWTCIQNGYEIASLTGPGLYARSGETELEGLLATRTAFSPSCTSPWVTCRHTIRSVPLPAAVQPTLVRLTSRKWLDVDFIH